MPRGVAIPDLRDQLFAAAERLLLRDGPSALSSRAITAEAGCAKGVLHNHFGDLDDFLAEFVLVRFHAALHDVADIRGRAGQATVPDNLAHAAFQLLASPVLGVHSIFTARPSVIVRLRQQHGHHSPDLRHLERALADYLESEKALGRVPPTADTAAAALAIVATLHRIVMDDRSAAEAKRALDGVLGLVVKAITPPSSR